MSAAIIYTVNYSTEARIIQSQFAGRSYKIKQILGAYPPSIYLPLLLSLEIYF